MSAPPGLSAAIADGDDVLLEAARRTLGAQPDMVGLIGDEELTQLVHGFRALLEEAAADRGDATRRLVLETAIPALVEQGRTPRDFVRSGAFFAVALSAALLERVPEAERDAATTWLAGFFSDYQADVLAAAEAAG